MVLGSALGCRAAGRSYGYRNALDASLITLGDINRGNWPTEFESGRGAFFRHHEQSLAHELSGVARRTFPFPLCGDERCADRSGCVEPDGLDGIDSHGN